MMLTRVFTLLLATGFCMPAIADSYYCDGQVVSVGLNNGNGQLWVAYGAIGWQQICAIGGTSNGTQADACRGWMSLLLSAHAQEKSVRLYYDSATPGNPSSCAGFQPWSNYSPYFIQLLD